MLKRWMILTLILVVVLAGFPASAAEESLLFFEDFNTYAINAAQVNTVNIVRGLYRIKNVSGSHALSFHTNTLTDEIDQKVEGLGNRFVLSAELMFEGAASNLDLCVYSSSASIHPVSVTGGEIRTYDGKYVGGIGTSGMTELALAFNMERKTFSVYLDGREALSNWKLPAKAAVTGFKIKKYSQTDSGLVLDNIMVYNGEFRQFEPPAAPLNPKTEEYFEYDDDAGDFLFFDTRNCNTAGSTPAKYAYFSAYPKTNRIELPRLDYKNKNREDYIFMEKTTEDDCYFDLTLNKNYRYRANKTYDYFLIGGMVKTVNLKSPVQLVMLRDKTSGSGNYDTTIAAVQPGGALKLVDGTVLNGVFPNDEWVEYKAFVNLSSHTADVYINGEKVGKELPINEKLSVLNIMRVSINNTGEGGGLYLKDFSLIGLREPYVDGVDTMTSIFPEDDTIIAYLQDKTVLHAKAQTFFANGRKQTAKGKVTERDGEVYVTSDVLEAMYGKTVCETAYAVEEQGRTLYPFKQYSREVMNRYVTDDSKGLLIAAKTPLHFDMSRETYFVLKEYQNDYLYQPTYLELINDYMYFERPDAQQIRERFNASTEQGTKHPRIMADQEDFARIRQESETDETFRQMRDGFLKEADNILPDSVAVIDYQFEDAYRTWSYARKFLTRMQLLGFAYQMTGDDKYPARAWKEMQSIDTFPDFNTSHIIDVCPWSMGVAIAYDWMYDAFDAAQKKTMEEIMYRNVIEPMRAAYYGRFNSESDSCRGWNTLKVVSNYNTLINAGNIVSALAMAEIYPEECFDMISKGLRSMEYTLKGFPPEGGWIEGTDYLETMTFEYLEKMVKASEIALGSDWGIMEYEGVSMAGRYMLGQNGMLGTNNFHDANMQKEYTNSKYTWLGAVYQDKGLMAVRKKALEQGWAKADDVIEMLDYDPKLDSDLADSYDRMITTAGIESVGIRASYSDPEQLYLGTHFGAVNAYHAHYDVGTFVFDILGERWAIDLGKESYALLGVTNEQLYRKRTEGHNTFVINPSYGIEQSLDGYAPIVKKEEKARGAFVAADVSSVYDDIDSGLMGYYVGDDMRSLTMRGEFQLNKDDSDIYWFMHTNAQVLIDEERKEAILSQNGKSIVLKYHTNAAESEISVMPAESLPTSASCEGQKSNEGIRKVAIKLKASGALNLTVKLAPMGEAAAATEIMTVPISQWTIPDGELVPVQPNQDDLSVARYIVDGKQYDSLSSCYVDEGETMPEIQVVPADPTAQVEIDQAETTEDISVIRVYNAERTAFAVYTVSYVKSASRTPVIEGTEPYRITGIEVSSTPQSENHKDNMVDNNIKTRWTALALNESAVFDLGEMREVSAVAASFWQGDTRRYKFALYYSPDGETYAPISELMESSSQLGEGYNVFRFSPVQTRYIKLVGLGNSTNVNTNIQEFRILDIK